MKSTRARGPEETTEGPGGYTIVELLVVTVLSVLIIAAVVQTLTIQGQGFQHQTTVARSQSNARVALQVLSNELREISATDGDLVEAGETSLTVRSMRKVGIICHADNAAAGNVDVWALGDEFTAGNSADSVLVFLNHDVGVYTDDEWAVGSVAQASGQTDGDDCTAWTEHRLTGGQEGPYPTQRLSISGPDISGAAIGGIVRSFEHITYGLDEVGGVWSLVRQENGDVEVLVEDLAPAADSGLVFAYVDTAGSDLTVAQAEADPGSIGRISLTVKAREQGPTLAMSTDGYHDDRLSTSVFLRNNLIGQTDPPTQGGGGTDGGGTDGGGDDGGDAGGGDDGGGDTGGGDDGGGDDDGGDDDGGDDSGGSGKGKGKGKGKGG